MPASDEHKRRVLAHLTTLLSEEKPTCREIAEMLRRYSEMVERRIRELDTVAQTYNKALTMLEQEATRAACIANYLWKGGDTKI